ncbi:DUF7560 family zinc ribbon protein [Natronosalvus caseinilyticus]|uniref:DUF7560 family zinc ribbon protein n=1 Tax=Natronosalvus caseinilyticus TaxID=2953747 RepID=UPI0028AF8B60|nr:hypothetical protein [Natronosalvus caseinilyticus]
MSASEDYRFVCPECAQAITVNASMRDALVENGCVVCGSTVSRADFEELAESDA